jgi:hypothetical protein
MFTVCSETALKLQDQLDETQYGRLTLNFVETSWFRLIHFKGLNELTLLSPVTDFYEPLDLAPMLCKYYYV